MLYIVLYEIKDTLREERFLAKLLGLGSSVLFLPKSYFLESDKNKESIYEYLKAEMRDEDLLLISRSSMSSMSGWLPTSAVNWLRKRQ